MLLVKKRIDINVFTRFIHELTVVAKRFTDKFNQSKDCVHSEWLMQCIRRGAMDLTFVIIDESQCQVFSKDQNGVQTSKLVNVWELYALLSNLMGTSLFYEAGLINVFDLELMKKKYGDSGNKKSLRSLADYA